MNMEASLLTARTGFFQGMGSVLDIGATFYTNNISATPESADRIALTNDWLMVGNQLKKAMSQYEQQD